MLPKKKITETICTSEREIVLHLRNDQERLIPEITQGNILNLDDPINQVTSNLDPLTRRDLTMQLRLKYWLNRQENTLPESSALTEAPSLFVPDSSLVESNLRQIITARAPELVNGQIINENAGLESLSSLESDSRDFMIAIPEINEDLSAIAVENLFSGIINSYLPIPDFSGFIPYGSHLLNETRTVRQALIADLSSHLFGELPRDPSLIRLRQLRESVIEGAFNNGAWYQPGDTLPQSERVSIFHLISSRVFSLFRPETLVYLLNYLSQTSNSAFFDSTSLGAIATIFLFSMLRPLFLSSFPPSFWLLSFDRLRLFFIT